MMKRAAVLLLCVVLAVTLAFTLVACNDEKDGAQSYVEPYYWDNSQPEFFDKHSVVFLGDSIAEGILGASPVSLRHEFAYPNILGRRNDFRYVNHSVSGHLTKDLLSVLTPVDEKEDGARMLISNVRSADIIHISILGNDVLQDRADFSPKVTMHDVIIEAANGEYTSIDKVLNGAGKVKGSVENIRAIVDRLRELNPTATIIFQKVYNPIMDVDTPLIKAETRAALGEIEGYENLTLEKLHELGERLIKRLNGALDTVLAQYEAEGVANAFYTVDAREAFNAVYDADRANGTDRASGLIYPDGVHPSNYGHAVLADLTQKKLAELGFVTGDGALKEYKSMRKNLLADRYDAEEIDIAAVSAAIDDAQDCDAVTQIFFDAVKGKNINYENSVVAPSNPDRLAETKFLIDDNTSVMGMDLPSVEMIVGLLGVEFARDDCYIALRNDGTITLRIMLDKSIGEALSSLLGILEGSFDMTGFVDTYLKPLFPGFDLNDIKGSFGLIERSLGAKLVGIDFDNSEIQALLNAILNGGSMPESISFDQNIGIEWNGTYCMKKVADKDGNVYKAVYITPYDADTRPYIVMTLTDNEDGTQSLSFNTDFVKLKMHATTASAA